jgi:hypothetical protein
MDHRLKEKAIEAGAHNVYVEGRPYLNNPYEVAFTEKALYNYTESIVKEAIQVLENRFMGDLNREDMEVKRCIADLKKHFGIEE